MATADKTRCAGRSPPTDLTSGLRLFEHTFERANQREEPSPTVSRTHDPKFAAVLLLAEEVFPLDGRVWKHLLHEQQRVDFESLLGEQTFSPEEHFLWEVAANLWQADSRPTLRGLAPERLGHDWPDTVLRALTVACGVTPPSGASSSALDW